MNKLTDERAWALIAEMGWGGRTVDYKHLAETYFKLLGKKTMAQLEKFVGARVGDLHLAVKNYEKNHASLEVGSDDGFSDLRYHVVGMGKDELDACIADPRKLAIRYRMGEYEESFAYVFQEPDPPRTAAQKEKAINDLIAESEGLDTLLRELDAKVSALRMKADRITRLAATVKNDRKSA